MNRLAVAVLASGSIFVTLLLCVEVPAAADSKTGAREYKIGLEAFKILPSESGPVDYYKLITNPEPHIHAEYRPPWKTAVRGYEIPKRFRSSIATLSWKWRARTFPRQGDECTDGKGDSAAVIYVTWKRGLRWYSLKYAWSAVGRKGQVCDVKRNPFRAQDTIIVDSGPPLNEWRAVRIVPDKEFRNHFEDGDPEADVPDLVGIGLMTDGDQTKSKSAADYADFVITMK